MAQASAFEVCGLTGLIRHGAPAHSSGPDFHSLAMLPREQALRHERRATNAPLRGDDCQFAPGFKSANLRKTRRPQRRRSALRFPQAFVYHGTLTRIIRWFPLASKRALSHSAR